MSEFNIVGKNFRPDEDKSLFLTIEEEDNGVEPKLIHITDDMNMMAHLLHAVGKFASVGEAKKNGWKKPIPTGWNHIIVGKAAKRIDLFIWNPST